MATPKPTPPAKPVVAGHTPVSPPAVPAVVPATTSPPPASTALSHIDDDFGIDVREVGSRIGVKWWFKSFGVKDLVIVVQRHGSGGVTFENRYKSDISMGYYTFDVPSPGQYTVIVYGVTGSQVSDYVVVNHDNNKFEHPMPATPVNSPVHQTPDITVWTSKSMTIYIRPEGYAPLPDGQSAKLFEFVMGHKPQTTLGYYTFVVTVSAPIMTLLIILRCFAWLCGRQPAPMTELLNVQTFDKFDLPPEKARFRVTLYGWKRPELWRISSKGHVRSLPISPGILGITILIVTGMALSLSGVIVSKVATSILGVCTIGAMFLTFLYLIIGKFDDGIGKDETPLRVRISQWKTRLLAKVSKRYVE